MELSIFICWSVNLQVIEWNMGVLFAAMKEMEIKNDWITEPEFHVVGKFNFNLNKGIYGVLSGDDFVDCD